MKDNKILEKTREQINKEQINIEIEIIINENLYKKNMITSEMYNIVNEKLLKIKSNKKFANTT